MQLVGEPRDVDQAFSLQLLDSDRVDVAPGSNVVREDDQLGRRVFQSHLLCHENSMRARAIPLTGSKPAPPKGNRPRPLGL